MYYKEFNSFEELGDWVKTVYSRDLIDQFDLNKQLPDSPLTWYTNSFSREINKALRQGILEQPIYHYEILQQNLLLCKTPDNVVVFRYMDFKEFLFWAFFPFFKKRIVPNFVSTTFLPVDFTGQARSLKFIIKILIPKGLPGMYITDLENVPVQEYEFLIPHHMKFVRKGIFTFMLVEDLNNDLMEA